MAKLEFNMIVKTVSLILATLNVATACALGSAALMNETSFQYNASVETTMVPFTSMDSIGDHTGIPVVSVNVTTVEKCDGDTCIQHICRVEGTVSRPSFYARCGLEDETAGDLTKYCMCATAYHTAASNSSEPSYVPITPDINCQIPETPEEQELCEQTKCNGLTQKLSKTVHICNVGGRFYCACFN